MKYGEKFTAEKEVVGIPAEEFENVIMTYLPVSKEELKEWAVYDEQSNMFIWEWSKLSVSLTKLRLKLQGF